MTVLTRRARIPSRPTTVAAIFLLLVMAGAVPAAAQNYSFDARKIALGGIGGDLANVASTMIEEQRPYGTLVLPFGVIQLVQDINRLNPGNDEFDPVRTFEYAASPIHFIARRGSGSVGNAFVEDLINGRLSADLSRYAGFEIEQKLSVEGLAAPNWGGTFKILERGNAFHGIYVGAGPYLAVRTSLDVDGQLREVLAGNIFNVPNATMRLDNHSDGQIAAAITGGYRGRFAIPGLDGARDGLYVGLNYHYLRGFQYRALDGRVRFDTDAVGVIIDPIARSANLLLPENPVVVDHRSATSGTGFATDLGAGVVFDRWEFGIGANGLGNRIDWTDFERTRYTLPSVLRDLEFVEEPLPADVHTLRVELPVSYSGNVGYHADRWSALGDVTRGFNGTSTHLGYEYRLRAVELRGGGRYSRDRWHPSGGIGLNMSPRVGVDVAAFTTTANIQREQRLGLAVSFRFNRIP